MALAIILAVVAWLFLTPAADYQDWKYHELERVGAWWVLR